MLAHQWLYGLLNPVPPPSVSVAAHKGHRMASVVVGGLVEDTSLQPEVRAEDHRSLEDAPKARLSGWPHLHRLIILTF
jgi:hypothetical protein